jgi:hypothetical protein
MKHALIKDNQLLQYHDFEVAPVISANKGQWVEVVEEEYPSITDNQVSERHEELVEGKWVIGYTVREKTPLELWEHPDFAIRILCDKSLILEYPAFYVYFTDEEFPIVKKGNQRIIYFNQILPQHQEIFNALITAGKMVKEDRPDQEL